MTLTEEEFAALGGYLWPLDFTGRTSGFVGREAGVRNLSARYIFQCVDGAFAVFDKQDIGTTQALQFAGRYWAIGAIDKQRLEFVPEAVRPRMRHENMDRNIEPEKPQAAGCTFEEILGRQRHYSEAASRHLARLAKYLVDNVQARCGQEAQRDQVTLYLDGDGLLLLFKQPVVAPAVEFGVYQRAQDDGQQAAAGAGQRAQERGRAGRLVDDVLPVDCDGGENREPDKEGGKDDPLQRHGAQSDSRNRGAQPRHLMLDQRPYLRRVRIAAGALLVVLIVTEIVALIR